MRCPQGIKSSEKTDTFHFCLYHHQFLAPRGATVPSTVCHHKLSIKDFVCACTGTHALMWVYMYTCGGQRSTSSIIPQGPSTFFFQHAALTGLAFAGKDGWSLSPRNLSVSTSSTGITGMHRQSRLLHV